MYLFLSTDNSEKERDLASASSFLKSPQQPGLGREQLEAGNFTWVFHGMPGVQRTGTKHCLMRKLSKTLIELFPPKTLLPSLPFTGCSNGPEAVIIQLVRCSTNEL